MGKDVMSAEERLAATINLEPVDRVCCAPIIDSYAGQFVGMTNKEFMWDWDKSEEAMAKLHAVYPIWDCSASMQQFYHAPVATVTGLTRSKQPGRELADNEQHQMIETEIMTREDYSIYKEKGPMEYQLTFWERAHSVTREQIGAAMQLQFKIMALQRESTYGRGQSLLYGGIGGLPFDNFSLKRSMERFYKDMYQMPDQLEEILWMENDAAIQGVSMMCSVTGIKRAFIGGVRGSGQFMGKKHFERFIFPQLKAMVAQFVEIGITPILHFDSDWTKNLEYFLELPKGKFVLELDSSTDIFKAKEILNGHCAIKGDVSAALLTVASTSEVDEYCKKLITTVGKGGGLIYSCGCTLPINARNENVKAFFEAVDKYGRYN